MYKTQQKYSIVEFLDGLQIVPSCWINKHQNESIWPSHVKSQYALDKLLTRAVFPAEAVTWDTCKIKRTFGSADTWERAQEKLVEAMDTSTVFDSEDFTEEEWRLQMKKHRRENARKINDSSGSTDEGEESTMRRQRKVSKADRYYEKKRKGISSNDETNNLSQLPALPKHSISLSSQLPSLSNSLYKASTSKTKKAQSDIQMSSETLPDMSTGSTRTLLSSFHHFGRSDSPEKGIPLECNALDNLPASDYKNFMIKSMVILLRRTKALEDRMNKIEAQERQAANEEDDEEDSGFPLQTEGQLLEFERKLKNPIFFKKMSSSFKMLGGDKVNVATNAILGRLIADVLATKYIWRGRKGKKVFSEYQWISKLIIKTVHTTLAQCNDAQIIEAASLWLAQATTRLKRAEAKKRQEQILCEDHSVEQPQEKNNDNAN